MNKENAINNLRDIQDVFQSGFLVYGSALGAHRDNNIIVHDLDTDFGVFSDDFSFNGITELVKRGFSILNIYGMRHYGFEIAVKRHGIKTDIMLIYKDKACYWNSLWDNGGRNGMKDEIRHEYMLDVFSERQEVTMNGFVFSYFGLPYIEAVYGENWSIPKKSWNWRTEHYCIKKHE